MPTVGSIDPEVTTTGDQPPTDQPSRTHALNRIVRFTKTQRMIRAVDETMLPIDIRALPSTSDRAAPRVAVVPRAESAVRSSAVSS